MSRKLKRLFEAESTLIGSKKSRNAPGTFREIDSGESSSIARGSASSSTSQLHDTVRITTIRSNVTSSYRPLQSHREVILPRLPPPSMSPLEEASRMYDEFGSLHVEPSDYNDTGPESNQQANPDIPSPDIPARVQDTNTADPDSDALLGSFDTSKRNRMKVALERWLPRRSEFLDEILRDEGCGDGSFSVCSACQGSASESVYKCVDCLGNFLYCKDCILKGHIRQPLHRIKRHNGRFFENHTLKDLGLRIQLGHENGRECTNRERGPSNFTVIHTSGVHRVSVDFCKCNYSEGGHQHYMQLLRVQWFPATAITFDCLDLFMELSHASKINTYDFYTALAHRTDNIGIESTDSRYHEFSLTSRLWKHLTMLKRAGRAHDPSGIGATKEGSLAVLCPACLQPCYNLPDDWKTRAKSFLYTLFLSLDANFKLKRKERGFLDIELAPGWAYFVEEGKLQNMIKNHAREVETNSCRSMHNALLHATTLNVKGYAASGVGAVVCGRHSLVRPNGVADLQLGERYVNMDYIALSTLMGNDHTNLFITYDIACQWSKNFFKRQTHFPEQMRIPKDVTVRYAIPSFHIAGHGKSCQMSYSLNLLPGAGRTYGEGIESQWAQMNIVGASTREQAPGMRHENLIDQWGANNWGKVLSFGPQLKKNLKAAVEQYHTMQDAFNEFLSTFESKVLEEWEMQIVKWEKDPKEPNPYAEVTSSVTYNKVKVQLANEEAALLRSGVVPAHSMTVSAFLSEGLSLEEQQRLLLLRDPLRDHQLNNKTATLQERRNSLWTEIEYFWRIQNVYMPYAASLHVLLEDEPATTAHEDGAVKHPETLRLCLPSSIPTNIGDSNLPHLRAKECRLRLAQAEDALNDVRRYRRTLTGVSIFKKLNTTGTGQRNNTRVRVVYERLDKLCVRAAEHYRAARGALLILDPDGKWKEKLKELRDADVSGPQRDPDRDPSEGRYQISWIWRISGCNTSVSEDSEEFSESMRVEWSRSRARFLRWKEEIQLLVEEMRRVVAFFERKSCWWQEQRQLRSVRVASISSGLHMYAEKQSSYMTEIACRCVVQWQQLFTNYNIPAPWLDTFVSRHGISTDTNRSKSKNPAKEYDISNIFAAM